MEKYVVLVVEPSKPSYLQWMSEDELEDFCQEIDAPWAHLESLDMYVDIVLFSEGLIPCDHLGLPMGKEKESFDLSETRLIKLGGSFLRFYGTAIVTVVDEDCYHEDLTAKQIVKYTRMFDKYLDQ